MSAMKTPPRGQWLDRGDGIEEFVRHDVVADNELSDEGSIHGPTRHNRQRLGVASGSPTRLSLGLLSPPPTARKKILSTSPQPLRISHLSYESKLKTLDTKGRRLPRIAFRWYDANSQGLNSVDQIRAGLYKQANSEIPPPTSGPKLKKAFISHLTPEKVLSPFISVFENFLPALNRALRSKKVAYIAIIDLQRVEVESRKCFPEAKEVIWPIKLLIKQYKLKLRNHYKGYEWLIYGLIDRSCIVQTINVSDLVDFARTGRIRHMRDVLQYISLQQHAFGLLKNLNMKLPKTGTEIGRLVGKVLDHLNIPDRYKALVARKIMRMMKFRMLESALRQRAYLRGVYGVEITPSDGETDGLDDFLVSSNEEYDSDATYWDDDDYGFTRRIANRTSIESEDSEENDGDTSWDESDLDDEQALLYAQLYATLNEAIRSAPPRMLQMTHVEVPKLTERQLAAFKAALESSTKIDVVDLTKSGNEAEAEEDDDVIVVDEARTEDDDVIEVTGGRWVTVGYEQDVIEVSATQRAKSFELPVRSTSARTTTGPRGLARLEMDVEVMEIMKFD